MEQDRPKKPQKKKALADESFEDSLARLETLVQKLESGDLKLEDALTTFEEGIALTRQCQQALQKAEQRVELLTKEQGSINTAPFNENDS